jgi:hypothetical protein
MTRLRRWLIAWESKAQQRALDRQSPKWWEPRQLLLGTEDPSLHVHVAPEDAQPLADPHLGQGDQLARRPVGARLIEHPREVVAFEGGHRTWPPAGLLGRFQLGDRI